MATDGVGTRRCRGACLLSPAWEQIWVSRIYGTRTVAPSPAVVYSAHTGALPAALTDMTTAITSGGITAGPFINPIPSPPTGWAVYTYAASAGSFTITTTGDGATVTVP